MSQPRPKVLCIIDTLGKGGGAERLLVDLLPAMKEGGLPVAVAALQRLPNDHGPDLEQAGITVHYLDVPTIRSAAQAARMLRALCEAHGYNLFWGHLYYGNLYAWLARRIRPQSAMVATIHSAGYAGRPPKGLRYRIAAALESVVLSAADRRVAVSHSVADAYARYFRIAPPDVIHNGVDLAGLASASDKFADLRVDEGIDDFLAITPASFNAVKGQATLVEAIAILRDTHGLKPKFLLVGEGPLESDIRNAVNELNLAEQVEIRPVMDHDRLMRLLLTANAVVLPSRSEAFGLAAVEAMALGVPCILTDNPGFHEIVAGSAAANSLVPRDDPAALASALAHLFRHPVQAKAIAAAAQDHVLTRFSIGRAASSWVSLLKGVFQSQQRGAKLMGERGP